MPGAKSTADAMLACVCGYGRGYNGRDKWYREGCFTSLMILVGKTPQTPHREWETVLQKWYWYGILLHTSFKAIGFYCSYYFSLCVDDMLGIRAVLCHMENRLCEIFIAISPNETVALPLEGHVPTPENISLRRGWGKGGWRAYRQRCIFGEYRLADSPRQGIRATSADPSTYAGQGQAVGEPHCHQLNGAVDLLH